MHAPSERQQTRNSKVLAHFRESRMVLLSRVVGLRFRYLGPSGLRPRNHGPMKNSKITENRRKQSEECFRYHFRVKLPIPFLFPIITNTDVSGWKIIKMVSGIL